MPRQDLWDLFEESTYQPLEVDLEDRPIHPLPHQALSSPDLRRTVIQAQYLCQVSSPVDGVVSRDGNEVWDDINYVKGNLNVAGANLVEQLSNWSLDLSASTPDCIATQAVTGTEDGEGARDLRLLSKFMDSVSLINARLEQRPLDQLEVRPRCTIFAKDNDSRYICRQWQLTGTNPHPMTNWDTAPSLRPHQTMIGVA